jgi:hypothetical protein
MIEDLSIFDDKIQNYNVKIEIHMINNYIKKFPKHFNMNSNVSIKIDVFTYLYNKYKSHPMVIDYKLEEFTSEIKYDFLTDVNYYNLREKITFDNMGNINDYILYDEICCVFLIKEHVSINIL